MNKTIDTARARVQYRAIGLNSPFGFDRLKQQGKHTAYAVFLMFASNAITAPFFGRHGKEGLALAGTCCQSVNLANACPLFCLTAKRGIVINKKKGAFKMRNLRKGYSRPIFTHPIRTFSTLKMACKHADLMLERVPHERINIQRTAKGFVVSRVIGGAI